MRRRYHRTPGSPAFPLTAATARCRPVLMDRMGASRFDLKYGLPGLTHDQLMTTIELYGQRVVPRVRELLG